jgi:hypothetical protein
MESAGLFGRFEVDGLQRTGRRKPLQIGRGIADTKAALNMYAKPNQVTDASGSI